MKGFYLCIGKIGTVNMATDLYGPADQTPTFGSGGGALGGQAGGRIILSAESSVTVESTGKLLAEGASSRVTGYGAGSGGGILIIAAELYNYGSISVQGGAANSHGSAGGGGRISVKVITMTLQIVLLTINCL